MKIKLFKKLAAFLSAGIIGSTMMTSSFAFANTYKETWDNTYGDVCYLNGKSYHLYAVSGRKDNDSAIYFANNGYGRQNSTAPCYVYVYGYNQGDPYWVTNDVSTYNGRSVTTSSLYIPTSAQRLIRQYIKEKGYNGARLLIKNLEVGYSRGTWAPDSTSAENRYYQLAN